jgi:tRNA G18 (ribose-2'-O)-methylase SpoU
MRKIVLIVHNVRSCHNVGSLLRTAEGLGVETVYLTGYTPYPHKEHDERLPHIANKIHKQIQKTALDAEEQVNWEQQTDVFELIDRLKAKGYKIAAVEQSTNATKLHEWMPTEQTALLVGREVEGVEPEVLAACDACLEIPMFGKKESFNVVQAAAMAMYHCRFA